MTEVPRDENRIIDLHTLVANVQGQGPLWSYAGDDLNVNLVAWPAGAGVSEHVNREVEVLLVGVEGNGVVTVSGEERTLHPGEILVIPRGTPRAIVSQSPRFAYLSVHRRRAGMWPTHVDSVVSPGNPLPEGLLG
jgi:quercetin dioxygenase-like cupin family protein